MSTLRSFIRPEQLRELGLLLLIVVAVLFFGNQIENYYQWRTFNRITASVAIIAVVAVGQTLVVLTRNIDLSVGAMVGFTAFFVGKQVSQNPDIAPVLVIALAMGAGAIMGLINGLLVAYGNVPSIVVTLGTMALYRGVLYEYSDNQSIPSRLLPDWIVEMPQRVIYTLPEGLEVRPAMAMALVTVVIFQIVISYTAFGRRLYAIGSNPETAKVAGIPSRRIVTLAYTLCGALAGLGGFMYLARFGNITVVAAQGLELDVVAAVVVGGVNIFGGSGTMIGGLLGAILIGTLEQSLIRMQINEFWKDALLGLFILLAVASDALLLTRLRDLWARRGLQLRMIEKRGEHAAS